MRRERGFTLIEVLVVVFIIGIIVTFASLSISDRILADHVETEAQRLQALFSVAGEDAEMHGTEVGFIHTDGGYAFVVTGPEGRWIPVTTGPLRPREVKAPIALDLHVEGRSVPPTPLADLIAAGKAAMAAAEAAKAAAAKAAAAQKDGAAQNAAAPVLNDAPKHDDDETDTLALKPQAMFLSSGEATAIRVDVSAPGVTSSYRLEVDNLGRSTLTTITQK